MEDLKQENQALEKDRNVMDTRYAAMEAQMHEYQALYEIERFKNKVLRDSADKERERST
jgi:hypothetical protein